VASSLPQKPARKSNITVCNLPTAKIRAGKGLLAEGLQGSPFSFIDVGSVFTAYAVFYPFPTHVAQSLHKAPCQSSSKRLAANDCIRNEDSEYG